MLAIKMWDIKKTETVLKSRDQIQLCITAGFLVITVLREKSYLYLGEAHADNIRMPIINGNVQINSSPEISVIMKLFQGLLMAGGKIISANIQNKHFCTIDIL